MSTFSWSMIKARALLCAMLCVPLLVSAAEFVVTTTADLVDTKLSDGLCGTELVQGCSLRAALQQANSLPGEDVIILGSNVYELSLSGRGEDEASAGDLDVTDHVIIRGDGNTVIDAKGQDRIFDVHAPDGSGLRFTLQGITLTGGNSFNEPGGAIYLRAIDNEKHLASDVLLEDLVLRLNDAGSSHGGGLAVADRSNGWVTLRRVTLEENQARNGGAVHLVRNVEMVDSLIRLNSASEGGGGIFQASSDKPASRLILRKSKVLNNSGSRDGGGIHSLGDLEVREGSEVRGNKVSGIAFISGGGIFSSSASNLFVTQTIISDNEAKGVGSRGGGVYFSNETEQMGELYDVEVGGNKAAYGAGIYGKNLRVLRHVYVHDNLAELAGGGLYLKTESPVVTSIEHSVVDANVSRRVFGAAFGGGIYYDGTGDSASLSLRNSTVSRNVAEGIGEGATGYGGGLFVTTGGSASANLTSFVDNGSTSGGHHVVNLSEINVTQSLFAGPESTLLDCLSLPTISFGHNIDRDASCVNHETDLSLSRVEMKIAELPSMNGDYRQIYTLAPESPAVDAIPADVCVASVDQRHFSRSGGCDVGAYEVDAVAVNAGSIAFADDSKHLEVEENAGKVVLRVLRQGGSEGELRVAYRSYERTARGGCDHSFFRGH